MGKKILSVDDDQNWRFIIETTLKDAGHELRTAADPSEAMRILEDFKPALVILDLDIAGEDGIMLMKFLRQNHPDLRIMLYTSMDQDGETIMKALELGAAGYARKGSPEQLLQEVEMHLS